MDVSRIRVKPLIDTRLYLRFEYHNDVGTVGIYVDMPIADMVALLKQGDVPGALAMLAADIENAHESMRLIYDYPEKAVELKIITAAHAAQIVAGKRTN